MLAGQADFDVVGEAENGRVALDVVAREVPDVVLMDLRMPVLDGVSAIERLQSTHPSVQVLVLTTYDADTEIVRAVEAGATGCLLKDAPREVLFRAVRAAARGESVLAPELTAKLFGRLRAPKQESLTEREIEVLALVAKGNTNRAIGRELSISEATVKTHLVHAFTKLGVDDRTAAVTVALERGLLRLNKPRR
ncbi:response regulator transcription factor [Allokutzneria multivorans]|uniref:Response regulator transcription factor n=2 Tax=Allokutzneria multivorans TaxID=1142134 RepID=A0ABP7TBT0_9PSEU